MESIQSPGETREMVFVPDIRFEPVEQVSGQLLIRRSGVVPYYLVAKNTENHKVYQIAPPAGWRQLIAKSTPTCLKACSRATARELDPATIPCEYWRPSRTMAGWITVEGMLQWHRPARIDDCLVKNHH